ncbi:MAG: hypothetical protein ABL916_18805 [Burkholderiaceae bacterium]
MNELRLRGAAWWLNVAPQRHQLAVFWHRHLGRPAWLALALLGVFGLVHWQVDPVLAREQSRLVSRQQSLVAAAVAGPAIDPAALGIPALQELPSERQRGRDVALLVATAQRVGLGLDRADYAQASAGGGDVTRLSANLPLTGSYTAVRRYVADVLNEMPHAALESLQIERPSAKSTQLQATARLVLFYRQDPP